MKQLSLIFMAFLLLSGVEPPVPAPRLYPVLCDNGFQALSSIGGEVKTACNYLGFRNLNRDKNPKYAHKTRFYLGQKTNSSWVLLDSLGEELPGPPMIADEVHSSYHYPFPENDGFQFRCGEFLYIYLFKPNQVIGPFVDHWNGGGCLSSSFPSSDRKTKLILRHSVDSTLYIYNDAGALLFSEEKIKQAEFLTDNIFYTQQEGGAFKVRTIEKIFHSSNYYNRAYSYTGLITLNKVNEDRSVGTPSKFMIFNESGEMLLDSLYSDMNYMPHHKAGFKVFSKEDTYGIYDSNWQKIYECDECEIQLISMNKMTVTDKSVKPPVTTVRNTNTGELLTDNIETITQGWFSYLVKDIDGYKVCDTSLTDCFSVPFDSIYLNLAGVLSSTSKYGFRHKGKVGLLDSSLNRLLEFEAKEMFSVKNEGGYGKKASVPFWGFKDAKGYGLYNFETQSKLDVSSDKPLDETVIDKYFIVEKSGKQGLYNCDQGLVLEAKFDKIQIYPNLGASKDLYQYNLKATKQGVVYQYFYTGDNLLAKDDFIETLDISSRDYLIRSRGGTGRLISGLIHEEIWDSGMANLYMVYNAEEELAYFVGHDSKKGTKYFDLEHQVITPQESKFAKVHSDATTFRNHLTVLKEKKRKDPKQGLYDLRNQNYLFSLEYDEVRFLNNEVVSLQKNNRMALSRVKGNGNLNFEYVKLQADRRGDFIIGKNTKGKFELFNNKGERLNQVFYDELSFASYYVEDSTQTSLVSGLETKSKKRFVIDATGKQILAINAHDQFLQLDGPLDMFKDEKSRHLVKDRTTKPLAKSEDHIKTYHRNGQVFYLCQQDGEQTMYNSEGNKIFSIAAKQAVHRYSHIPNLEEDQYFTIIKNHEDRYIYTLYDSEGTCLLKDCFLPF